MYLVGLGVGYFIFAAIILTILLPVVKRIWGHSALSISLTGLTGFVIAFLLNMLGASLRKEPEQFIIILICFVVLTVLFISRFKKYQKTATATISERKEQD